LGRLRVDDADAALLPPAPAGRIPWIPYNVGDESNPTERPNHVEATW